jgi:hypothetical protein
MREPWLSGTQTGEAPPHPRVVFQFRLLMRVPVQVIAVGAWCVKIRQFFDDGSDPKQLWFCELCFVYAKASRTRAMFVDRKKTEGILERIAAKQAAAAAVPSPLPSIQRPRAWLSRAQVHTCTSTYIIHTHSTRTHAHPYLQKVEEYESVHEDDEDDVRSRH